jgi:hypothetical protein
MNETAFIADDGFARYYAEKLWSWIPEIHRAEDATAAQPGVLRALIEVVAGRVAVARRSIDRLWEDAFIELCDDWAVSYIGDLVGTRPVHEINRRARRTDVARTIFYRRRKGTPRVLETLVRDITGWDGAVVEGFRHLARTRHGLDPAPAALTGRVSGTPPGGWARPDAARTRDLVGGPFDELFYTPDLRQHRGALGRHNITKLNLHLYRLLAHPIEHATPYHLGNGRYTIDPSGRDVPLFAPSRRSADDCLPALEWELPVPISCRLLGEASYEITRALVDRLVVETGLPDGPDGDPTGHAARLRRLAGIRFRSLARLRETLESMAGGALYLDRLDAIVAGAITADSAKLHLYPDAVALAFATSGGSEVVPRERVHTGDLATWEHGVAADGNVRAVIDPARGRFVRVGGETGLEARVPVSHYGFPGRIGAGTYDRRDTLVDDAAPLPTGTGALTIPTTGAHEVADNRTRLIAGDVPYIRQLVVQAVNQRRPYLMRSVTSSPARWTLTALVKPAVPPGGDPPPEDERTLTLDGIWLGLSNPTQSGQSPVYPVESQLVLDGVFDRVVIRNCTLDPGGAMDVGGGFYRPIPYVRLLVQGTVEELVIESSIVGPIGEVQASPSTRRIGRLVIRDSIVQAPPGVVAIESELGELDIARSTVFGDVRVNRIHASEALVQGAVRAEDNQHGCFRFSAAHAGGSLLPQRFASHLYDAGVPDHTFTSRRFGDPGYAQLAAAAAEELRTGAENGGEIGAWNHLLIPIKLADLRAKVDEYAPFGLVAQYLFET